MKIKNAAIFLMIASTCSVLIGLFFNLFGSATSPLPFLLMLMPISIALLLLSFALLNYDFNEIKENKMMLVNSTGSTKNIKNETSMKSDESSQTKSSEIVKDYFTMGCTKEEVFRVQGNPDRTDGYGNHTEYWYYGRSEIRFEDNKMMRFDNRDKNLKFRYF